MLTARGIVVPDQVGEHWRPDPVGELNVAEVLELADVRQDSGSTWPTFVQWLRCLYGDTWTARPNLTSGAFSKALGRLREEIKKCQKNKDEGALQAILKRRFVCPGEQEPESGDHDSPSVVKQCQPGKTVAELEAEFKARTTEKADLLSRLKRSQSNIRNLGKRLRRSCTKVEKLESLSKQSHERASELENVVGELNNVIGELNNQVSSLEQQKRALIDTRESQRPHLFYYRKKYCELQQVTEALDYATTMTTNDELEQVIFTLQQTVKDLKMQLDEAYRELEEHVQQESSQILTLEDGKYTDPVRQCCLSLLSHNVGIERVTPIIRTVIGILTGHRIGRLPSVGLLSQMLVEAKEISLMQVGEVTSQSNDATLHTDGTTKFGRKYGGYQVMTGDGSLSFGLADMISGSAKHTLDRFKDIVEDIEKACQKGLGSDNVLAKVVAAMKNTMSDRHAVEKNFNRLVEQYRSELLPLAVENWSDLSPEEQQSMASMNHFFCGLHFLVGLAEQAEAALQEWEKTMFGEEKVGASALPRSWESSEAGSVRLIRAVCKAFHKHGSEQAGCHVQFLTYLQSLGFQTMPLAAFKGNRFNIVFYNGAGVYFLRQPITSFLSDVHGTPNHLLRAVQADIAVPEFLAGCRALGLLDKLVTGPLWRCLQSKTSTILDMNGVFRSLCRSFGEWASDASPLLDGSARPFHDTVVHVASPVLDELLLPSTLDGRTQEALQLLCRCFDCFSSRMLVDHLPGGIHDQPSPQKKEYTQHVPKTNVISERDFAQLDRLLREKPNIATVALEGIILFSNNQTRNWLEKKSAKEKAKIIEAARKLAPKHRQKYKERCQAIWEHQRAQLLLKQQKVAEKRRKEQQEKEKLSCRIGDIGFWTTPEQLHAGLARCKSAAEKLSVLKTQLLFRRKVLNQVHPNKIVFQWSSKGHLFTWVEKSTHLLELIADGAATTILIPAPSNVVSSAPASALCPTASSVAGSAISFVCTSASSSSTAVQPPVATVLFPAASTLSGTAQAFGPHQATSCITAPAAASTGLRPTALPIVVPAAAFNGLCPVASIHPGPAAALTGLRPAASSISAPAAASTEGHRQTTFTLPSPPTASTQGLRQATFTLPAPPAASTQGLRQATFTLPSPPTASTQGLCQATFTLPAPQAASTQGLRQATFTLPAPPTASTQGLRQATFTLPAPPTASTQGLRQATFTLPSPPTASTQGLCQATFTLPAPQAASTQGLRQATFTLPAPPAASTQGLRQATFTLPAPPAASTQGLCQATFTLPAPPAASTGRPPVTLSTAAPEAAFSRPIRQVVTSESAPATSSAHISASLSVVQPPVATTLRPAWFTLPGCSAAFAHRPTASNTVASAAASSGLLSVESSLHGPGASSTCLHPPATSTVASAEASLGLPPATLRITASSNRSAASPGLHPVLTSIAAPAISPAHISASSRLVKPPVTTVLRPGWFTIPESASPVALCPATCSTTATLAAPSGLRPAVSSIIAPAAAPIGLRPAVMSIATLPAAPTRPAVMSITTLPAAPTRPAVMSIAAPAATSTSGFHPVTTMVRIAAPATACTGLRQTATCFTAPAATFPGFRPATSFAAPTVVSCGLRPVVSSIAACVGASTTIQASATAVSVSSGTTVRFPASLSIVPPSASVVMPNSRTVAGEKDAPTSKRVDRPDACVWRLPPAMCQGRIGGRVIGSNACTLIACITGDSFLGGLFSLPVPFEPIPKATLDIFLTGIVAGNVCHDLFTDGCGELNTDVEAALNMLGQQVKVKAVGEQLAFLPGGQPGLEEYLHQMEGPQRRAAVVLGDTEKSCVVLSEANVFAVFDSHAHGDAGACILVGSAACIAASLNTELAIAKRYGCIQFLSLPY